MRFVPIKNIEQQSVLALHRVRQAFIKARTEQANQIRGLLGEFGLVVPQGIGYITERVPALLEKAADDLPGSFRHLIGRLLERFRLLSSQVSEMDDQVKAWYLSTEASRRLEKIRALDRSRPARWSRPSVMQRTSTMGGSSPRGSAWSRVNIPAEASLPCWV